MITAIRKIWIKTIDIDELLENFFISAIVAVLGIRLFLHIFNYPQIGGNNLHIAHMLWGGFLMLVSIILLLAFLGRSVKGWASVIAGFGFGTFIDELGKFITRDNNYFYQPAVALIYIIFIVFFLGYYAIRRVRKFSEEEYLINSLEIMQDAVINDLDEDEKKLALKLLAKSDQKNPITKALQNLYLKIDAIVPPKPNIFIKSEKTLKKFYFSIASKEWFIKLVTIFFMAVAFINLSILVMAIIAIPVVLFFMPTLKLTTAITIFDYLSIFASFLAAVYTILGVLKIRLSRLTAYRFFKQSLLISIFVVQVFTFYKEQLSGFTGLLFNIFLLICINFMIEREKNLSIAQINK